MRRSLRLSMMGGADQRQTLQQNPQIDVIVVDATSRQSMTRRWLTLAIDVHLRMVVGAYLSLEEPSVVSVALCPAQFCL
jgi:transposase InsO family protein